MPVSLHQESLQADVVIVGAGPVGLAMALSVDRIGLTSLVVDRLSSQDIENPAFDGREIALTHQSTAVLRDNGSWAAIPKEEISPIYQAHILDNSHGQDTPFVIKSSQSPKEPLGFLVSNHLIRKALFKTAVQSHNIDFRFQTEIESFYPTRREHAMRLKDSRWINSKLVIAADGRFSHLRSRMGIGSIIHNFARSMIVCRIAHDHDHNNVAIQRFDKKRTIALLPLRGRTSSLVITLPYNDIIRLAELSRSAFTRYAQKCVGTYLGILTVISSRHIYPLVGVYANRFTARRLALIGDSAVGMHPATAHGFNFGLKGQDNLAAEIAHAFQNGEDIGGVNVLRSFECNHRVNTAPLFAATNGIAALYTRESPVFQPIRKIAIKLARNLPFLSTTINHSLANKKTMLETYTPNN